MARVQELPAHVPRREGLHGHFIALLGASVVMFSVVVGEPSVHDRLLGLAGFLLWLLGLERLLLFGQVWPPLQYPVSPGALATTTARIAAGKLKHLFSGPHAPEMAAAPA